MPKEDTEEGNGGSSVIEAPPKIEKRERTEHPKMYHVILLNDLVTPFFVVTEVIMEVFGFSKDEAIRKMLTAHKTGKCLMGTFTRDIADSKALQVSEVCVRKHGPYPLGAVVEEAPSAN